MLTRYKEWDDDRLNVKVAQAAHPIVPSLVTLHATGPIPAAALVDPSFRFGCELVDGEECLGGRGVGRQATNSA